MLTLDSITNQIDVKYAIDLFWELLEESPYKQGFFEENIELIAKLAKRIAQQKIGKCKIEENDKGIVTYAELDFNSSININLKFKRFDNGNIEYILIDKNDDGYPEYIFGFDENKNVILTEIDENSDGHKDVVMEVGTKNKYYFCTDFNSDGAIDSIFFGKKDSVQIKQD